MPESLIHCFFECTAAKRAWAFACLTIYKAAGVQHPASQLMRFSWQQCIFGTQLPEPLRALDKTWSLIRGAVIWIIWRRRNDCIFNNLPWPNELLERTLWDALLDLGRTAWANVKSQAKTCPAAYPKARRKFVRRWVHNDVFCSLHQDAISWNYRRPAG